MKIQFTTQEELASSPWDILGKDVAVQQVEILHMLRLWMVN